jgi:DNA polymerase III alpha subunit (gram-positive type)
MQPHPASPKGAMPPLLTCPNCQRPMRIRTVEVADGREKIDLNCDRCGTEATQDNGPEGTPEK